MNHTHKSRVSSTPRRLIAAGFSLIEMAVVLVIVTFLFGVFITGGSAFLLGKTIEGDRIKLRAIETAIATFVSVNGRLPCPADGRLLTTSASAGVELRDGNGDCTTAVAATLDQTTGVVPWTTLGIGEVDASDSYEHRIMYRVAYGLARNAAMDFTACDPAGTGAFSTPGTSTGLCSTSCLAVCLATCAANSMTLCTPPSAVLPTGRGIQVRNGLVTDASSVTLMDNSVSPTRGAAYVLIAHGKNGVGGYNRDSGAITPGTAGNREVQNANGQPLTGWYAINTNYNDAGTTDNFDDLVLSPSVMRVVTLAQRGPRAH